MWKKAINLVVDCYQLTKSFPAEEKYGLISQLQRAAVSIPANIAEGHSRWYKKEFVHYLSISYCSIAELETHLVIAGRLNYLKSDSLNRFFERTATIGRMINGLKRSLKS